MSTPASTVAAAIGNAAFMDGKRTKAIVRENLNLGWKRRVAIAKRFDGLHRNGSFMSNL